ncbi:MAG: nucleotide pyrophosphohydrolase [Oligoflexia bacterium]|nr:nucleotide pyrophosphohydrolase [Oligoflexia bacterium]
MPKSSSLESLTRRIKSFRDARDWKQFHTPKSTAISLVLEAAELAEMFQWGHEEELAHLSSKQKKQVADELCDVLYWVLLIANDFEIDLDSHFKTKMRKNERKYPIHLARGKSKKR